MLVRMIEQDLSPVDSNDYKYRGASKDLDFNEVIREMWLSTLDLCENSKITTQLQLV